MSRRNHSLLVALATGAFVASVLIACGSSSSEEGADAGATVGAAPREAVDSGRPDAARPPSGPPKRIFTKRFVVNVRARPDRESPRIGYLRAGAVLQATTADPVSTEGCREGWFELTTGGFVCNGRDVIAFEGRRLPERRPAQPDWEEPLPYRFARTRRDNTPMYRRLPSDLEAAVHEGYRVPGMQLEHLPDGGVRFTEEVAAAPVEMGSEESAASASAELADSRTDRREAIPERAAQPAVAREPQVAEASAAAAAAAASGEPPDEEARMVTLGDLQGERGGLLHRRLVKGFIVSLDRDMRAGARRYWRTLSNGFVPYHSQVEVRGSTFQGVRLDPPVEGAVAAAPEAAPAEGEAATASAPAAPRWELPIGFVMSSKTTSFTRGRDGRPRRSRAPGYHYAFRITGRETHRDREYLVGHDERLYETSEIRIVEAHDPPPEVGPEDHWIEVDLGNQSLVAYEGRTPVYATLVSTGRVRDPEDPLRDMRTPTGLFRITSKHVTHTMDGDHAVDGPYSIEDVPYVMYFQLAYALHSAFWHDGFGRPRSHGCVNLAPLDARWIFQWAGPALPEAWHGSYPTETQPGTWLWIHGETPEG
ncbi:L,D-transpeptidase [Sandaracinus amylolyticus]|uniref:L,D-TPase catalytic domain-containing protein n=1 Tax=Sandaracinus amylolyticus TaxID=927083 RepID=A0A0F6SFS1_9BACT|nr:L,D-transpeptidase [Sandaracinus amylolyticus]AKF07434.1 Hypothetical protein DB32_004583 [Sandaracinus amylolyticus]